MSARFLEAVPDLDGYHSEEDENCSAVAYVVRVHTLADGTQCWRSNSLIRENDLSLNTINKDNPFHREYVFSCGSHFDVNVRDSPDSIRN
jgi:hypothetical protein